MTMTEMFVRDWYERDLPVMKNSCHLEYTGAFPAVADPGFPVGGVDLRSGHFLPRMYAKMKELDPVGGVCPACP